MTSDRITVESPAGNNSPRLQPEGSKGIKSSSAEAIPIPKDASRVISPSVLEQAPESQLQITRQGHTSDIESTHGEDTRTAMVLRTNPTHVLPEVQQMEAVLLSVHSKGGRPHSPDVADRYRRNAVVFARHGITTTALLRRAEQAALLHDVPLKIIEGILKMSGYTGGLLVAANFISPKVMPAHLIPFLNGALTCLSANISGRVTSHAMENAYASGQSGRLPASTAQWAGADHTLQVATRAGVNDLTRQVIPTAAALHHLAQKAGPIAISVANKRLVLLDAISRPVSSILDTLGVSVIDVPAKLMGLLGRGDDRPHVDTGEVTFRESFRLQHPDDLDAWLTSSDGKSALALLKPTSAGTVNKLAGALDGLMHVVGDMPHVAAMMTMVGVYILMSVYAGNGAVASYSKAGLAEGMESAESAAARQVIFSGGEVALEFGLVALPIVLSALTGGTSETVREFGGKLVDQISPATHKKND